MGVCILARAACRWRGSSAAACLKNEPRVRSLVQNKQYGKAEQVK